MRRIDPDAEVARLAQQRKLPTDGLGYRLLLDEVHEVARPGADPVRAHIIVTASEDHPVPHDLGAKIAAVIREHWPARQDGT